MIRALLTSPISQSKAIFVLVILTLLVTLPGLASLSVLDRDEARYAQASVQMAESGDYLNIRFQDEARNKKPAGIYWLQVAAIKTFSAPETRKIWVQRLPSVLGALLAVLATYFAGAKLIGRQAGFIGAITLALSMMMIFEGHIAKTDAVLCAMGALCFSAIAHIRTETAGLSLWKARPAVWIFWVALGFSILIKGPVIPTLVALSMGTLLLWERRGYGMRQFVNIPAIAACFLIFLPWAIAIGIETNGAFFTESLGHDLGGKMVSAQESHPGPFGYHLALLSVTFWPGSIFLLPAFAFAIRTVGRSGHKTSDLAKAVRLCLAWILPYWILIEVMPTKLPHYSLPVFPALALLVGMVFTHLVAIKDFKILRFINGSLFLIVSAGLLYGLVYAQAVFSGTGLPTSLLLTLCLAGVLALLAGFAIWSNAIQLSFLSAGLCAIILNITAYGLILPSLTSLRLADQLEAGFREYNIPLPREGGPLVQAINFTEPSLVYHFGKDIRLGDQIDLNSPETWRVGQLFILDTLHKKGAALERLRDAKNAQGACLDLRFSVEGLNYSRGDTVDLRVLEIVPCD